MINYHFINSLTVGLSLKSNRSIGEMRNRVFKIKCFGEKKRKCFRSVPHIPTQIILLPSPRKYCHTLMATKRLQHESFVVQCCFDYFKLNTVIGLVFLYGSQLKSTIYLCFIQVLPSIHVKVCILSRNPH